MKRRSIHNAKCWGLLKNGRTDWRAMREHQRRRAGKPMATPRA